MIKLKAIIIISFCMVFTLQAQKLNKKIIDTKTQKEILVGKCNLNGLKTGEFGDIFNAEYKKYIPDSTVIALLQSKMKKIKIEIILGAWCGDSEDQVPRFIKILDALKYKTKKINILCLDRCFKADGFDKEKRNIQKVPTFIIYHKKKEIGRIIEIPTQTLEKDLLDILHQM